MVTCSGSGICACIKYPLVYHMGLPTSQPLIGGYEWCSYDPSLVGWCTPTCSGPCGSQGYQKPKILFVIFCDYSWYYLLRFVVYLCCKKGSVIHFLKGFFFILRKKSDFWGVESRERRTEGTTEQGNGWNDSSALLQKKTLFLKLKKID